MTETILAGIVAIITAPLSALLTAVFLRSKHKAEVDQLRADVQKTLSDVRGHELDNDKKAINMIMELVVEPLRRDMKLLQRKLDRFTNAIEKINTCPHADACPVEHELRRAKENGEREPSYALARIDPDAGHVDTDGGMGPGAD